MRIGLPATVESLKSNVTDILQIIENVSKWFQKMIIFGKFKLVMQMSGLDPEGGRRNIFARIIFSVAFFLFILSTSILLTINFRRDIDQALPILPLFLAFGSTIATYFHLVINREQFYSIFEELQDIVHESL